MREHRDLSDLFCGRTIKQGPELDVVGLCGPPGMRRPRMIDGWSATGPSPVVLNMMLTVHSSRLYKYLPALQYNCAILCSLFPLIDTRTCCSYREL
jgi:hypothetical protein